jgi:tetratricopeptide (TPR) repeat protein
VAQTSRTGPAPDTPRLLVAVFSSGDRLSGVQIADAIRTRVTNAVNVRTLYVIPKEQIEQYLTSSGYKADSALGPADLKELAKLLRGDEVLLGTVTKTGAGLRIEPRLALARDVTIAQPLPAAEATSPGDAARQIERSLMEARKQLADVKACENGLRDQKFPVAIAAAQAGILKYPQATLARLCLANALQNMKAPPDSVLKVVSEVRRLDPKNSYVLRFAFQAYTDKADQENVVRTLVDWLKLEPTNQTLQGQVVNELAKLGRPAVAIPIIEELLAQNPGDPQMLRSKWLLTLAAAAADTVQASRQTLLAAAVQAGESMARSDTSLADSTYFARQIAAASALTGQPQKAAEFASLATQKFPNSASFWFDRANAERKAGQLQMAQQSLGRVLSIDPKYPNAGLLLAQTYVDMNQPDSAVAAARRAVASGEDAKVWGPFLLAPTNAIFKRAQETKNVAEFRRVYTLAKESDRLSPTPTSKFFVGVSAYYIAADAIGQAQPFLEQGQKASGARQRTAFGKACPLVREAQEMILEIQTNMPAGGSVDPGTAQQILGWVGQVTEYAQQAQKAACK